MAPWDQVALTQQVSDRALTSLNVQSHGRLAAVGDAGGWGTAPKKHGLFETGLWGMLREKF